MKYSGLQEFKGASLVLLYGLTYSQNASPSLEAIRSEKLRAILIEELTSRGISESKAPYKSYFVSAQVAQEYEKLKHIFNSFIVPKGRCSIKSNYLSVWQIPGHEL